jgi:hypothetical protein
LLFSISTTTVFGPYCGEKVQRWFNIYNDSFLADRFKDGSLFSFHPYWEQKAKKKPIEAPIARRAMADRFKDGSLFLASFVIFNIYNTLAYQNTI